MTSTLELAVAPRVAALPGELSVRRVLPLRGGRMLGPFAFLDHLDPFTPPVAGTVGDVAPHPHIGLSTLSFLLSGALYHRDSLGSAQRVVPGEVNWMTAGRGIVHSERITPEDRKAGLRLEGLQAWVALPADQEEREPAFEHHAASALPVISRDGARLTLVAGRAYDQVSPVTTYSPLFYLHARVEAGRALVFDPEGADAAFYLMTGEAAVDGEAFSAPTLLVFRRGCTVRVEARTPVTGLLLGGAPLPEHRTIWWNFVSTSKERIERAKADWTAQRMGRVPGETEILPLP